MQLLMNLAASLAILTVVGVMAVCCLRTLQSLPARLRPLALKPRAHTPSPVSRREQLGWFVAGLLWLWVMVAGAYLLRHGSLDGLMEYFSYRFIRQGDASNYLYLAEHGYAGAEDKLCYIVFYPLYPLLMRLMSSLTGSSLAFAGVLVSHLCYAASAPLMRALAGQSLPPAQARCATAAMLLYPFSFYCFGLYTESLFMLLTLGCLLCLRRGNWWPAGGLALLAALCRTQGIALCFACAYAFLSAPPEKRGRWTGLLASLGAVAGFGGYLALNWAVSGEPFGFLRYQREVWFHEIRWFGENLASQLGSALTMPDMRLTTFVPEIVLYFLGCFGLSALFLRERRSPEGVYAVAFLGMSYISSWLISGARYMYGCVGLYLLPGLIRQRWLRVALLLVEAALAVFYTWQYVGNAKMW